MIPDDSDDSVAPQMYSFKSLYSLTSPFLETLTRLCLQDFAKLLFNQWINLVGPVSTYGNITFWVV